MDLYHTLFKLVKKIADHAKTVQILANQDLCLGANFKFSGGDFTAALLC